jgi:sigma-B regulation protein RsbU (phosphoserine phosphatase)
MLHCRFSQRYDAQKSIDNVEFGRGITGAAAETRKVIRVGDVATDPRYLQNHEDIRSEVAVPLILHDRVVGVMDLESVRLSFFTDDHVRALSLLAPQIATSVENARLYEALSEREQRMEQDLQAAFKLQSVLIPRTISDVIGVEIGIKTRPAREISGDFYDFFEHSDDYTLIAFGDVSGKGAAAALYGSLISGLLRILAPRRQPPGELMRLMNEALLERKVDAQYATLSLVLWDANKHVFTIASAGGLAPLLYRKGAIIDIRTEGVPIGLLDAQKYEQVTVNAEPDDLLILYSDGVEDQLGADAGSLSEVEASLRDLETYGRTRLEKLVMQSQKKKPQQLAEKIFADIDAFRASTPLTDDQTVVALRIL